MKRTTQHIRAMKGERRIVCLTAYDCAIARVIDGSDVDIVLVGDSLGMTVLGYATTLPVTMEEMLHHTSAVVRGVENALVIGDMPFMSYQVSVEQAIANAGRFLKEAGADAVKIEGGAFRVPTVKALVQNGIPTLGHIGLTPQSIREMGGYHVQGRKSDDAAALLADAVALANAGAFAIVLECIPAKLASEITAAVPVPTIGIGAGKGCDGQVLVTNDLLGLYSDVSPKFVKRYAELGTEMAKAFSAYRQDVQDGNFPADEHSY